MHNVSRRTIWSGLAAIAFASPAYAGMFFDPEHTGKLKPSLRQGVAAVASPGLTRPTITAINPDGWSANDSAPSAAFDYTVSPQYIYNDRQGFDATGAPTTYREKRTITSRMRYPWTDERQGSNKSDQGRWFNANLATYNLLDPNRVAMDDHIYDSDTIVGGSAVNNSTVKSPKPVAWWAREDRRVLGTSFPRELTELVAAHRNARNQSQVAAVVYTLTDSGGATKTFTVSSTVVSDNIGDKNKVLVYRSATDIDITSFADGKVTLDAKVFPWIGAANANYTLSSVRDSAQVANGTNRAFCQQVFLKDASANGKFNKPPVAYVASGGTDSTGVVTTDGTRGASFLTLAGALAKINSQFGTMDGAKVRIVDAVNFGTWGVSPATTQGLGEYVIEADPAAAAGVPVLTLAANFTLRGTAARFDGSNLKLARSTGTPYQIDGTNVRTTYGGGLTIDNGSQNYNWHKSGVYRLAGVAALNTTNLMFAPGASSWAELNRGLSGNAMTIGQHGVLGTTLTSSAIPGSSGNWTEDGTFLASLRMLNCNSTTGAAISLGSAANGLNGGAILQSVIEFTAGGSTAQRVMGLSPDGAAGNITHLVIAGLTVAGVGDAGRLNWFYNETVGGSAGTGTLRSYTLNSVTGCVLSQLNTKHDTYAGVTKANADGQSTDRVGGWEILYGVGWSGNIFMYADAASAQNGTGSLFGQAFSGIRAGATSVNQYDGTSRITSGALDVRFKNPQCTTATVAGGPYTAGAGNGDYWPTAGSIAAGVVPIGVLSHDLKGNPRAAANDTAGAYLVAA